MRYQSFKQFCDCHWELACCNKWHPGISKISTPLEIAVGAHFHMYNMALKLSQYFYLLMEKPFDQYFHVWFGGKVQPENTYSFILNVTGQVWVYQKGRSINTDHIMALIQAVFNISDHFWAQGNWRPINKKTFSFQDRFCFLKARAHYFTVLIYFANWRTIKLGIFAHFIFTNSPRCSQRINSPIYVYSTQIASCFLWVLDHSHDSTSSYYYRPKKCLYYPLTATNSIYHPKPVTTDHLTIKSGLVSTNPIGKDEVRGWSM